MQTYDLRQVAQEWDAQTWENYLDWYQSGQSEKLISNSLYLKISDELVENIFCKFGSETQSHHVELCRMLLSALPSHQQKILKFIYFEGRTLSEIAKFFKRSPSNIHQHQYKALTALKREFNGNSLNARQYIEGHDDFTSQQINSIWDIKLSSPIKSNRSYHKFNFKNELTIQHPNNELRVVFREISDSSLEMVYLMFFCGLKLNQIAQKNSGLIIGSNNVEQIIDATIFKIKYMVIQNILSDQSSEKIPISGQQGSLTA